MFTIQWRPIINALTKPLSYRILFVPRNTAGYDDMAADISASHPNYNADLIRSLAPLIFDWILQRLINGDQVTLKDAFNFAEGGARCDIGQEQIVPAGRQSNDRRRSEQA